MSIKQQSCVEAMKAIQMVYANTTKHDWPDDIWDAICKAVESEVTDLDAICQDLQEKTYTQAMRIAELEAKLSEAEKQEPVAWRVRRCDAPKYWTVFHHKPIAALQDPEKEVQPLYAEPQSTQENIESIGFYSGRFNGHDLVSLTTDIPVGSNLYTHPQPKQPLTDGQINKLRQKYGVTSDGRGIKEFTKVRDFVRAIEAADGIKETT